MAKKINKKYNYFQPFSCGLALVNLDDKWGYIDFNGIEVIKCQFEEAEKFHEDLALVSKDEKKYFINKLGEFVFDISKYERVQGDGFFNGFCQVSENDKVVFLDKNGNPKIKTSYEDVSLFSEGMACFEEDDKKGYIDMSGKVIIEALYDNAFDFSDGLALVYQGKSQFFIDKKGNRILDFNSIYPSRFCEGLASFDKKNGLKGYIDKTGKEIIPCKYNSAGCFREGIANVEIKKKNGYIKKDGTELTKLEFDSALEFEQGIGIVTKNDKYGAINNNGKLILELKYDDIVYNDGILYASFGANNMYFDKTGILLLEGTSL